MFHQNRHCSFCSTHVTISALNGVQQEGKDAYGMSRHRCSRVYRLPLVRAIAPGWPPRYRRRLLYSLLPAGLRNAILPVFWAIDTSNFNNSISSPMNSLPRCRVWSGCFISLQRRDS